MSLTPFVINFGTEEYGYINGSLQRNAQRPESCLHCGQHGSMIGHGYYRRKPCDSAQSYPLWIKRWQCKECRRTTSTLPNFLLRYRHYLLWVIFAALSLRFEWMASWSVILAKLAGNGYPAIRTIQRWCKSFEQQAERWLPALQEWLVHQDLQSTWLDSQAESLQVDNPESALLAASKHLLAWSKTQRDCGSDKRFSFLWLWGANRGLGRLV